MEFTRQPVINSSRKLSSIEMYLLIDAYQFLKASAVFPHTLSDITEVEILFLQLAYEHYADIRGMDVNNPAFEEGMEQVNAMDRSGFTSV